MTMRFTEPGSIYLAGMQTVACLLWFAAQNNNYNDAWAPNFILMTLTIWERSWFRGGHHLCNSMLLLPSEWMWDIQSTHTLYSERHFAPFLDLIHPWMVQKRSATAVPPCQPGWLLTGEPNPSKNSKGLLRNIGTGVGESLKCNS